MTKLAGAANVFWLRIRLEFYNVHDTRYKPGIMHCNDGVEWQILCIVISVENSSLVLDSGT